MIANEDYGNELKYLLERRRVGQLEEARLKLIAEYGNWAARKILNIEMKPVLDFVTALGTCEGENNRVSLSRSEDVVHLRNDYDYDDPAMCEVDSGTEYATVSRSDFEKLFFLAILNAEANGQVSAQYSLDGLRRADNWMSLGFDTVELTGCSYRVSNKARTRNISIRISVTLNPEITFKWHWEA